MTLRANSAEGGSNGTTVTTGNSGGASGDAFNTVSIGTGGSATFTSASEAHGTLSYSLGSATGATFVAWTGWNTATAACRFYFMFPTLPSAQMILVRLRNAGGVVLELDITAANKFQVRNQTPAIVFTGTTTLSANTWYRVEFGATPNATTAAINVDYYVGDSLTPVETGYATTTGNTGTGNFTEIRFGPQSGGVTTTPDFDDLAFTDLTTTYIGPFFNVLPGAAAISATAGLGAAGLVTENAVAPITATASLSAGATQTSFPAAALSATATLSAGATLNQPAVAAITATATLSASGVVTENAQAALTASASLSASGLVTENAAAAISATAVVSAAGTRVQLPTMTFTGLATLSAGGVVTTFSSAAIQAVATLAALATQGETAALSVIATAVLSASGTDIPVTPGYASIGTGSGPYARIG